MSTWIFSRKGTFLTIGLLSVLGLSACGGGAKRTPLSLGSKSTINVAGDTITVKGPAGFCVDQSITEITGDNAFVLLGSCAAVAPSPFAPKPDVKALLTASIAGRGPNDSTIKNSAETMDVFFRSETGRAALSRSADAETVSVLETFRKDETFYIRATDSSEGIVPGAASDYWRAYFDLGGHIASVSVIGFQSDPLSPAVGLETLQEFTLSMKTGNGIKVAEPVETTVAEDTSPPVTGDTTVAAAPARQPRIKPVRTLKSIGFLRRLFN